MANRTRSRQYEHNRAYRVSGSAAYQPEFDGSAVRVRQPRPETRPQVQPRRAIAPRPRVQVRPAGTVSLLAVVGLAVVAVCAALLVVANVRLMVVNDETVDLRAQLKTLQTEEATLLARQEQSYDLAAIQQELTASGEMVKPQPSQFTYISTSQADSVVKYQKPGQSFRDALYEKLRDLSSGLLS